MQNNPLIKRIEDMLREDVGAGDVTSSLTPNRRIKALVKSNSGGFVSGLHETAALLRRHRIKVRAHVQDGGRVRRGQNVFTLEGRVRDLFPVERIVLNLISRMGGITTLTMQYAMVLRRMGSKSKIVATRKTAPGLMRLDKKAVLLGGGLTHRMGLYDMVLIKDNHLAAFGGNVKKAVQAAKSAKTGLKIEVEVTSARDAVIAAESGADMIMLDNMTPAQAKAAIQLLTKRGLRKMVLVEISGGVNLSNLRSYGRLGADWISTSKLTSAAPAPDYTLEVVKVW